MNDIKKIIGITARIILSLAIVVTQTSCNSAGNAESQAQSVPVSTIREAVRKIPDKIGLLADLYDQGETERILGLLSGSLVEPDPASPPGTIRYIGALAETLPSVSGNGLIWTFRIREGLSFSDGTPIDAYTFVQAMQTILNPANPHPEAKRFWSAVKIAGAGAYASGEDGSGWDSVGVHAPDRLTLQFTLESPVPSPVGIRALNIPAAYPAADYDETDILNLPNCAPYKASEHISGELLVLEKNIYYPNAHKYKAERIELYAAPDGYSRDVLFNAGLTDSNILTPVNYFNYNYKDAITDTEGTPWFMYINTNNPASSLSDINLRKALFWGIDREYIVKKLFGVYTPTASYISLGAFTGDALKGGLSLYRDLPESTSLLPENGGYDPELALEYFNAAYENNGNQRINVMLTCFEESEYWGTLGVTIRDSLMELFGADRFHLYLELKPTEAAYAAYAAGGYELGFGSAAQDNYNVWSSMAVWTSYYPGAVKSFSNADFDKLHYECLFGELMRDYPAKAEALFEMERLLGEYVPAVPLFQDTGAVLGRN